MQYTQACIYTYNVCYPIIGAYVYMNTGTLDKINTSAVFKIALVRDKRLSTRTSKQPISSSVRQVKSYNHILFAFEVATVRATTDDSQNKHCQVHSKVIHTYNCLSTVSGLNQLLCRRALWCRLGRSQTVFYSRLFALIAMFLRLK